MGRGVVNRIMRQTRDRGHIRVILQEPIDAVRRASFFIGSERENDVTGGHVTFLLESDQSRGHDGVAIFHVLRAAAIEVAVFFDELKRVGGPVFAAGLDHIEMAYKKNRLVLAAAMQSDDKILLTIIWTENAEIAFGESGIAKALRHCFRRGSHAADGISRIEFDYLLENIVGGV